jgi:hypothetical protein
MSDNSIAIALTVAVAAIAFVLAAFILTRMARKRGVRIRDLIGPGAS